MSGAESPFGALGRLMAGAPAPTPEKRAQEVREPSGRRARPRRVQVRSARSTWKAG